MDILQENNTICALASAQGSGAISVIRISGCDTIDILSSVFKPVGSTKLSDTSSHYLRFGTIFYSDSSQVVDEVLTAVFRSPHSYTGEDSAEIYCHGSDYIVSQILKLLISNGATLAQPGEFTKRAFINGKMDLAQAEAVADLISSETKAAHDVALRQMKGGFSKELSLMRGELIDIVSLMELELDFSEEDVEFADRSQLNHLIDNVQCHINKLIKSFDLGNVIKNGVPVAIVGATNTGKSTLLNTLLGEERAIVSDIHGTTRDTIEETLNLDGIVFRFIDTAGIRNTQETIEMIGIERTYSKMKQASIIIMMLDAERPEFFEQSINNFSLHSSSNLNLENNEVLESKVILVLNKSDMVRNSDELIDRISIYAKKAALSPIAIIPISAKKSLGIDKLTSILIDSRKSLKNAQNGTMVTNIRHYEALIEANDSLNRVRTAIADHLPTDLISQDIREALYFIGTITGEITSNEILANVFKKFCIGK